MVFSVLMMATALPFATRCYAQQGRIDVTGVVVDSITGERLEFITIQEKGTANGTITNTDGVFHLSVKPGGDLVFSCVGYRSKTMPSGKRNANLTVRLVASDYQLKEVVIKPKREHYRRKDNPSVALAKKVIAHKDDHSPYDHSYYSNERYDRMTYSFNNFDGETLKHWKKKFDFIENYVDTAVLSGSPILPVSTEEKIETNYFRRSPRSKKTVIEAHNQVGLDDMLPNEFVQAVKTEVFPEIDINDNDVFIFTNKFVSPLSSFAPAFYKFYILDTLKLDDGLRYVDLGYAPLMAESFGFIGHLYVSLDSTYFVRRAELNIPPDINLNFVRNMRIVIDQDRLPDSTRVVRSLQFDSEMNVTQNTMGLYAHRTCAYSRFSFEQPADTSVFAHWGPTFESEDLSRRDDDYWDAHRFGMSVPKEKSVSSMLSDMRQVPFFYYGEKILTCLFKGYVPLGSKPYEENEFLYGPLNTTISFNTFEGARLRAGGITTARLNPHLFGFGYLAYGTKDHEWKYDLKGEWAFKKKKMHANEFPIHSLRAECSYDTKLLGQDPVTSKDNFLLSVKRNADKENITYERRLALTYTHEFWSGFSFYVQGRQTREYATHRTAFRLAGSHFCVPYYDMTVADVQLRFAPHETFIQSRTSRTAINHQHPIFVLTHSAAKAGVLGSEFDYQRTDFKFTKRFWLSAFGWVDANLKAGKVWTQSPFTMLCMPNANLAFTIQSESFAQMNPMEFVNDEYAQWDLVYFLNGCIFNNIPLLKRLKLREVVSFRGVIGSLSEKNNPVALDAEEKVLNPNLYEFPSTEEVYQMGKTPYMEFALGIENIFKVIRVDYIRRLSYLDHPNINKNGVQVSMHITF